MKKLVNIFGLALVAFSMATVSISAHAEQTAGKKAQEGLEDAGKSMKKAGRDAKQKGCEMINGKLECLGEKVGNKVKDAKGEMKDKANDGDTHAH